MGTVGYHVAEALRLARRAGYALSKDVSAMTREECHHHDTEMVRLHGASVGHAFRAAEMSYDLGGSHEADSLLRTAVRAFPPASEE